MRRGQFDLHTDIALGDGGDGVVETTKQAIREVEDDLALDTSLLHHHFPDGPIQRQVAIEDAFGGSTGPGQSDTFLAPRPDLFGGRHRFSHQVEHLVEGRLHVLGCDVGVSHHGVDDGRLGGSQRIE